MPKKSNSTFGMVLLAVGGYFAYENWPAISAWFSTVVPMPTAGAATASGTYPNSPVPTSYSTLQTFVDTLGNQWQFSTQTNQWVIASPAHPAATASSPGTVVSTSTSAAAPPGNAPQPPVVPASAGTVVSTAPPLSPAVPQGPIVWRSPPFLLPPIRSPRLETIQAPASPVVSITRGWMPERRNV
jgi:hypothetical protein